MKCYKLHGLLPLFLLFFVFLCPTVKGATYPVMTTDQAEAIIDYYRNANIQNYYMYDDTNVSTQQFNYLLSKLTGTRLANKFNELATNWNANFTWEDVTVIMAKGEFNKTWNDCASIYFLISSNDANNSNFSNIQVTKSSNFNRYWRDGGIYEGYLIMNGVQSSDSFGLRINKNITQVTNQSGICYICPFYNLTGEEVNIPYMLNLGGKNTIIQDNANIRYNTNKINLNNIGKIEESSQSVYGYAITENSGNDRINLYPDLPYLFNTDIFVGSELSYNYQIYRYSGNEKIVVSSNENLNPTNTTEYGHWYKWSVTAEQRKKLSNNTKYYLDFNVNYENETKTVCENLLMFTTYYEVITNSGDTGMTGTITNESGDTTGQIDLSGIESGIGNLNNNITNTGNAIIETIGKQNEEYWGSSGELTIENHSGEAQTTIDNIIENASGEIEKTEISKTLNNLEKRNN